MDNRVEKLVSDFERIFQLSPQSVCHAPGRVNLIGDHTDYNQGFVLPAAIDFGTDIAASKREDRSLVVVAADLDYQRVEFSLDDINRSDLNCWSNYAKGTIKELLKYYDIDCGVNLLVSGNVPQGAGLSSSASFEIAVLKMFAQLFKLKLDGVKAAVIAQAAENEFVGCQCGIMDQLIAAKGEDNQALLIDCETLQLESIRLPEALSVLIINSNVPRGLVDSEYNLRRKECEQVAAQLNVMSLRQISLEKLQEFQSSLADTLFKRAQHVIGESKRVQEMVSAFQSGDIETVSRLMYASHESLKSDFEVSCEQTDFIVETVKTTIGSKGGARMTGGGFGGCVVCLLPDDLINPVIQEVKDKYYSRFALNSDFYLCTIQKGAFSH